MLLCDQNEKHYCTFPICFCYFPAFWWVSYLHTVESCHIYGSMCLKLSAVFSLSWNNWRCMNEWAVYPHFSNLFRREVFHMTGEVPPSMSGTCGCSLNGTMYIFGGCDDNGQTNQVRLKPTIHTVNDTLIMVEY